MLTTTYQLLRSQDACDDRYGYLKEELRKRGHKGAIPLALILEVNGLDDALWALCAVPMRQKKERDRLARLVACDYAERALPAYEAEYPGDSRPRDTISCARSFANGEATGAELAASRTAASAAYWAAFSAAYWVAYWVASSAASSAAYWTASSVASNAAYWTASSVASNAAELKWQAGRLRHYLEA